MPIAPNLPQWVILALPIVVLWDIAWRGLALWRAARRDETVWFVCMLVINSVGILPIVYLLLTRSGTKQENPKPE